MEYTGSIVVLLSDNEEVTASCTEEFLSDITETQAFDEGNFTYAIDDTIYKSDLVGFVSTITIDVKEHQNVSLSQNDAGEWEVTEVLD